MCLFSGQRLRWVTPKQMKEIPGDSCMFVEKTPEKVREELTSLQNTKPTSEEHRFLIECRIARCEAELDE